MSSRCDHRSSEDLRSKRQQILDAAYVIFSKKGYHQATIDEIIALADTGKGTVYNYFVNKEQLFYTLIQEKSAPFSKSLEQLVGSSEKPLNKISQVIRLFLEFYVANADLWRVLMHEMRGLGGLRYSDTNRCEGHGDQYREHFRQSLKQVQKILEDGVRQGVLRPCDTEKAAYGLFSVVIVMVFQKFVTHDAESISQTAEAVADIFLHGVAIKNR